MPTLPKFKRGQRTLNAADMNLLVAEVRKLLNPSYGPGLNVRQTGSGVSTTVTPSFDAVPPTLMRFRIEDAESAPDTLLCSPIGDPTARIPVAKPYLLRVFPFENDGRDGIEYEYASPVQRTATKGTGDEAQTETQVIVPKYVAGDIIYAMKAVVTGADNYQSTMEFEAPLDLFAEWIDMNIDGRFWAKSAGTEATP